MSEKLKRPGRYYPADVETKITTYLQRCRITFHSLEDRAKVAALEKQLIGSLESRLNVQR